MKIESVTGEYDGRDSQRHAEMQITIKPVGFPAKTFRHCDATDIKNWAIAEYPVDTPPFDIRKQFERWKRQIEQKEKAKWKR